MKAADVKRLAATLTKADDRLVAHGRMVILPPTERLLRALYLEDASNPQGCYLWAFVQPLFQPATSVAFTFGKRIGGESHVWLTTDPTTQLIAAVQNEALPFLREVSTPETFARWPFVRDSPDVYAAEARGYAFIIDGRMAEAIAILRALTEKLPDSGWPKQMKQRVLEVIELAESNPSAAREHLHKWEDATRAALHLA